MQYLLISYIIYFSGDNNNNDDDNSNRKILILIKTFSNLDIRFGKGTEGKDDLGEISTQGVNG